jgi:2-desacetyl-2-hydroxyethyl bacteriochlorophyllide A dehydrogenase
MKALVVNKNETLEYKEVDRPEIGKKDVLIKVLGCGICGTDMHVYKGMENNWPLPGIRGHEFAGIIEECGDEVSRFAVGDHVVVQPMLYCGNCENCRSGKTNLCKNTKLVGGELNGGFSEYAKMPEHYVFHVPSNLDTSYYSLVEPVATSIHGLKGRIPTYTKSMVIFGAGAQGLILVQLAKHLGVQTIIAVDVVSSRLEKAIECGATYTVNGMEANAMDQVREFLDGDLAECVVDAAGISITRRQALEVLKQNGVAIFLALGAKETSIDFMSLVTQEFKLYGTQCYTDEDIQKAIEFISTGVIDAEKIITKVPLADGSNAFEQLATNLEYGIKVVLVP